jgi:hypothetical protein
VKDDDLLLLIKAGFSNESAQRIVEESHYQSSDVGDAYAFIQGAIFAKGLENDK